MIVNDVALAHQMQATLTVCAVEIAIPDVSNALSSLIIDAAKMARDAEGRQSQSCLGADGMAVAACVDVRTRELKTTEPFVVEVLAEASRAYDLVLLEAARISRPIVEAVLFVSGRPLIL
ncbi:MULTISPECIES: hypothetical protein [Rhizobium]|uniref:hypothetical protein n=1 Tax=Rhizobium TaxID=379 RepID=UPI000CE299A9|nr:MULTISPECIES: hypothetical protein [Rhizobium]AVC52508.1 hypothetical protein RLV_2039 [Rhizobium leguminosarum bv. viciae]MBB4346237.1 hypothetical protein [Rhizobium leguminosarum]MBB5262845.1 hypothetical protein [Rhizobium leguminosarum]MBB6299356.1 hypothetical protein [Rhizobium leguminosarum]MDX5999984.1 hypothetical protein [Rhizobium leguminosarum]